MKAPKFNVLDTVYFINNNEIKSGIVLQIKQQYISNASAKCEYESQKEIKFLEIVIKKLSESFDISTRYNWTDVESSIEYVIYKGDLCKLNLDLIKSEKVKKTIRNALGSRKDTINLNYSNLINCYVDHGVYKELSMDNLIIRLDESKVFATKKEICECKDDCD